MSRKKRDGKASGGSHARRNYKDRLFCDLFSDRDNALSLFNAVNNTNYTDADALDIVTLKDVLYLTMHNDLAVCFHDQMELFEQQSSVNPNMALRGFLYFAREYEGWLAGNEKDIYGKKLVKLPAPRYYVLYNGREYADARREYRLSDAFSVPAEGYEWTAYMININPGNNQELLDKCEPLKGYMALITLIRQEQGRGKTITEAVETAIDSCISQGILRDYLIKHKAEVTGMILTEYNEKLREKTLHEEGWEAGLAQGRSEGLVQGRSEGLAQGRREGLTRGKTEGRAEGLFTAVRNLMDSLGISAEEAMDMLRLPDEDREVCRRMLQ